jgi:hypothetical protein
MIKDKHYRDLTEEELDSLGEQELIEKFMSDDVDQVLKYHRLVNVMKKNIYGSFFIVVLSIMLFNIWFCFGLIVPLVFFFMSSKFNNHLIWSVKSLKSTLYMFRHNGDFMVSIDYVFEKNLSKISHIDIGELYK